MSATLHRSLPVGLVLALLGTTSAFAVDGQAFAERLRAAASGESITLSFGDVATAGEDVTLNALTITATGPDAEPIRVGDVRFLDVSGSDEAGWRAERVEVPDTDRTENDVRISTQGVGMTGFRIAGTANAGAALSTLSLETATLAGVAVERGGRSVAEIENVSIRNEGGDGAAIRSQMEVGRFRLAPQGGPAGTNLLADLGYEELTGDMSGNASWNPADGALTLDPLQIEVENAGALSFSYTITGYTPSFIESLRQVSQQMQAAGGQSDQSGMAVIGLISQLYLRSAELSFTDRSLTNRVLDYYARQNNQTREQLVANLSNMMPVALAYLQNPEFQAQVATALQGYLQEPDSLRISIMPPAPVPATQIIGAGMGAPQTLPQVLNLSVASGN